MAEVEAAEDAPGGGRAAVEFGFLALSKFFAIRGSVELELAIGARLLVSAAAKVAATPPNCLDTSTASWASSRACTAAMSACSALPRAVAVLKIKIKFKVK